MQIFVLIFWLAINGGHVSVEQTELAGTAPAPGVCASVDVKEALAHVDDAAANLAKGWVPKIVCGIAAPEQKPAQAPKEPESNPGHGEWGNGPSGEL